MHQQFRTIWNQSSLQRHFTPFTLAQMNNLESHTKFTELKQASVENPVKHLRWNVLQTCLMKGPYFDLITFYLRFGNPFSKLFSDACFFLTSLLDFLLNVSVKTVFNVPPTILTCLTCEVVKFILYMCVKWVCAFWLELYTVYDHRLETSLTLFYFILNLASVDKIIHRF